jgi:hypothetical protein
MRGFPMSHLCWQRVSLPIFSVLLLIGFCPGCGRSAPFEIVPVSGTLLYEDGTPIPGERVVIEFHSQTPPKSPKEHPRKGVAQVNPDGSFTTVTTWKYADGAIVGPHKVVVLSRDASERPTGAVPKQFSSPTLTPLTAEVISGGPPLELKVPRPVK